MLSGALACAALVAGCAGGGGEAGPPPVVLEFASDSSSASEGTVANVVTVTLTTATPLAEAVTVVVSDAGLGTAQSGVDYQAFAPRTVTFPAGSTDGSNQSVPLTMLDDLLVEGMETIELDLALQGAGGSLGTKRGHTLSIQDEDSFEVHYLASTSSTADESAGPHAIGFELRLDPGVTLEKAVQIDAVDSGAGSATAGGDYQPFGTQSVGFATGSADGETTVLNVQVFDDLVVEGDETVVLTLANPSAGGSVGPNSTHTLTIADDDVAVSGHIVVDAEPFGAGDQLASGDTVDLGSQALDAGPNAGVTVRVRNLGGSSFDLDAPTLSGADFDDFEVAFGVPSMLPAGMPAAVHAGLSPLAALDDPTLPGHALRLDADELARLSGAQTALLHDFPIPGMEDAVLDLRRVPSPWARDAVLHVNGVEVPGGPEAVVGDLSLWRGTVAGLPDSQVFLGLGSHGCRGWIRLSEAPGDALQLVAVQEGALPGNEVAARLVWQHEVPELDAPTPDACAAALPVPGDPAGDAAVASTPTPELAALSITNCRLAVETDYQFWQLFGGTAAATTYATQLFAAISDLYRSELQSTLSVAYLGIWDNPGDPWSTPDGPGSTIQMLDEFRNAWAPSKGGSWPVAADLAHFVSGAALGGGVAYVNVLCNSNFGFGVSGSLNGLIDWGTFDGSTNWMNWDFVVVAHEIGHNFNGRHTHEYCPPLDQCYTNCNGATVCTQGTVMSYCHTCPGGLANIDLQFHPFVANAMRTAINASCLGSTTLAGGDEITYDLTFSPISSTGAKSATLDLVHTAPNEPAPFEVQLTGTATP